MDGLRNVVFSEMQRVTSPESRGGATSVINTAGTTNLVTTKLVDVDQSMQVTVVVMGRPVSLDDFTTKNIETVEDAKTMLKSLHETSLCGGGPKKSVYPQAQPASASVDVCIKWRHKKCPLLLHGNNSTCQW